MVFCVEVRLTFEGRRAGGGKCHVFNGMQQLLDAGLGMVLELHWPFGGQQRLQIATLCQHHFSMMSAAPANVSTMSACRSYSGHTPMTGRLKVQQEREGGVGERGEGMAGRGLAAEKKGGGLV